MNKDLYMIKTGNQYWYVLCDEDTIENFIGACQDPKLVIDKKYVQVTKIELSDLDEISNTSIV